MMDVELSLLKIGALGVAKTLLLDDEGVECTYCLFNLSILWIMPDFERKNLWTGYCQVVL